MPLQQVVDQVVDQAFHTIGAARDELDEIPAIAVEPVAVAAPQQLGIAAHHAQGLEELVRGHVRTLLELIVGTGEFGDFLPDGIFVAAKIAHVPGGDDEHPPAVHADGLLLHFDHGLGARAQSGGRCIVAARKR